MNEEWFKGGKLWPLPTTLPLDEMYRANRCHIVLDGPYAGWVVYEHPYTDDLVTLRDTGLRPVAVEDRSHVTTVPGRGTGDARDEAAERERQAAVGNATLTSIASLGGTMPDLTGDMSTAQFLGRDEVAEAERQAALAGAGDPDGAAHATEER